MASTAQAAGRAPSDVRLVAVTKTVPASRLRELARLGVADVGENRVQEALFKQAQLADWPLRWHLIGTLQGNKVRKAVGRFTLIHSVDRLELLAQLDRAARQAGLKQAILLQVNVAGERTKSGFSPEEVDAALRLALELPGLKVEGLMTIAPHAEDPESVRCVFRSLRGLRDACQDRLGPGTDLRELSMGMSSDFGVAIQEGATLVRVGTGIFGERPGAAATEEGQ